MNLFFILYENIAVLVSLQTFFFFLYLCKCITDARNIHLQSLDTAISLDRSVANIKNPIIVKYEDKYRDDYVKLQPICLSTKEKENLKNNFIMENTPLGNVIMYYNYEKNGFVYYSDSTMPYRFLETVGRKYIVTFRCKDSSIFEYDDDNNEDSAENTNEPEIAVTTQNNDMVDNIKSNDICATKPKLPKNVFAKFKNYNHPNSIPSASMAVNNNQMSNKNTSQKIKEVKENKNKYMSEGKIANFSFLKKVDKKQIIKRLNMTFAEFKKLQIAN